VRERFGLKRVVLVGDRGLITEARLKEEIRPVKGLDWITALRGPAIRRLIDEKVIQPTLFDERDMAQVRSPEYPGERLIVCYNPLLAEERARKREDLLQATERELEKIAVATRRKQRPLKGKEKIGLRVGKVINRYKVGKHFTIKITKTEFFYERDTSRIARETALDGLYVIRTSVPESRMDAEETVRAYKDLSKVEQAFRSLKTVDLMIRPIYHRLPDRVRAHAFLCMLAYYVQWHMRRALAPILFEDEEKDLARKLAGSVVAPARRSPKAERKARRKRTEEGDPVHSFRTLLKDLSTIARNRVRPKSPPGQKTHPPDFAIITTPTPHQRRILDLLGVPVTL